MPPTLIRLRPFLKFCLHVLHVKIRLWLRSPRCISLHVHSVITGMTWHLKILQAFISGTQTLPNTAFLAGLGHDTKLTDTNASKSHETGRIEKPLPTCSASLRRVFGTIPLTLTPLIPLLASGWQGRLPPFQLSRYEAYGTMQYMLGRTRGDTVNRSNNGRRMQSNTEILAYATPDFFNST